MPRGSARSSRPISSKTQRQSSARPQGLRSRNRGRDSLQAADELVELIEALIGNAERARAAITRGIDPDRQAERERELVFDRARIGVLLEHRPLARLRLSSLREPLGLAHVEAAPDDLLREHLRIAGAEESAGMTRGELPFVQHL